MTRREYEAARESAMERGLIKGLPGGKFLLLGLGVVALGALVIKMNRTVKSSSRKKKIRAR